MKNYKMIFSYDGSRYKGWQKLGAGELTVQAVIESAIQMLLQKRVEIHGSGRTDAGVHALGQAAHMKVPFRLQEDFVERLNEVLPEDIRILALEEMPGTFHARYDAVAKTYRYVVDTKEKPSVFARKYVCHYPELLCLANMEAAAKTLLGTHDFSSFTDDKREGKSRVRSIYEIRISCEHGIVTFEYRGDGFLQHMVRILTGTLLEIGCGKRTAEEILEILEKKERAEAGFMVPAKGLFLIDVEY